MPSKLVKHGSNAGYRAELETGNVCERCRIAHRQYASQFTKKGRASGVKYSHYDVIDHLYTGTRSAPSRSSTAPAYTRPSGSSEAPIDDGLTVTVGSGTSQAEEPRDVPSLADRVGDGLRKLVGNRSQEDYVSEDASSSYVHPSDADPEPQGWEEPDRPDEFVIDKAGMLLIEDNLGTYLSVLGITLEMIDPYCGPILAENFDNIVGRWTKVIARYPRAARLFMSKEGGTIFLWIGALQSTWPVLLALYDHHLAGNVKTDNLGRSYRVSKNGASKETVDATMPPQPAYAFTVD